MSVYINGEAVAPVNSLDLSEYQLKPTYVTLTNNTTVELADNTIYTGTDITTLTFTYPQGNFTCIINLTFASSGTISVTFPINSLYSSGTSLDYANGEVWEISVVDGKIVGDKFVSNT